MSTQPSLSIAEYATRAGISQKTVRRRISKGELPAELVAGPRGPEYRIPLSTLDATLPSEAAVEATHDRQAPVQAGGQPGQAGEAWAELVAAHKQSAERYRDQADQLRAELNRERAAAAALQANVARLEEAAGERDYLRERLAGAEKANEELRVLMLNTQQALQATQEKLAALPAPRPWWKVWG